MSDFNAIRDRAKKLIIVQFEERNHLLKQELDKAKGDAAARGLLRSGPMMGFVRSIVARELELRSVIAWESLVRVHKTLGARVYPSLRDELTNELNGYIREQYSSLSRVVEREANLAPESLSSDHGWKKNFDHIKKKHDIEVQLYVDSLQVEAGQATGGASYNFYGNVGAVQTGPYASANVVQRLSPEDYQALINALELVRTSLDIVQNLNPQKDDLLQIVDESVSELKGDNPNSTKIKTLLYTVAASIQTVASAKPAYETLKSALLPLGITLP
ncbi:MAG: hypothetical protein P8Y75_06410 [Nitrospirota bacterium]|jgi:hypothetical protein